MGKPAMYEICGYHPFVKSQMSIQGQPGKDGKELFSWAKVSGDDLGVGSLKIHVKMYRGVMEIMLKRTIVHPRCRMVNQQH